MSSPEDRIAKAWRVGTTWHVIDGREHREAIITQQEWSMLLDVVLRQESKRAKA